MVDKTILAVKTATVRDAVGRIREVLPSSVEEFLESRTVREVVMLNLFVAIQESIALAAHWLADEGWEVPGTHADTFTALAAHDVIASDLATRLRAAAGLRNLIAHRYGAIDGRRIFEIASRELDDLLGFCQQLVERVNSN